MLTIIQFLLNIYNATIVEKALKIKTYDYQNNVVYIEIADSLYSKPLIRNNKLLIQENSQQPVYSTKRI